MSGGENNWKPAALSRIESEEEAPNGFKWLIFAGIGLNQRCSNQSILMIGK